MKTIIIIAALVVVLAIIFWFWAMYLKRKQSKPLSEAEQAYLDWEYQCLFGFKEEISNTGIPESREPFEETRKAISAEVTAKHLIEKFRLIIGKEDAQTCAMIAIDFAQRVIKSEDISSEFEKLEKLKENVIRYN